MKELLNLKKEIQEHQNTNIMVSEWAEKNNDKEYLEAMRNKISECSHILWLIDEYIERITEE